MSYNYTKYNFLMQFELLFLDIVNRKLDKNYITVQSII